MKLQIKPKTELVVTFITGETKTYVNKTELVESLTRMIENVKNQIKYAHQQIDHNTKELPILEEELRQALAFKE